MVEVQQMGGQSAQDLIQLGKTALEGKRLDEAVSYFEKALVSAPFDARIHSYLSKALGQQGKLEDSLSCMQRALELDPNDSEVIKDCSRIFVNMGRKEDAREVIQSYVYRCPWDADLQRELTTLNSSDSSSPMDRDVARFLNEQGERQYQKGSKQHARACFEMALEEKPEYGEAHNNMGVILLEEGNIEEALEHFYKALEADPLNTDTLLNSAKGLQVLGDWDTAAEYLKLYLQQNPRDEDAWNDYQELISSLALYRRPEGLLGEVAEA